jgi:transglutaminase-like putative cysteine protease
MYRVTPDGDVIVLVRLEDLSGVKVPDIPLKREEFPESLAPSLFIQSDDGVLVARAREIVGTERNALRVSTTLVEWVYRNLRKRFSASFSNALDVLASGEGDCTEHAALFVALARAVGLPAREVAGIVYSKDNPGFYYHQWAEVYVGTWIAVDPTFGEAQADATHIAFARGNLLSQAKLVSLIGSLHIDIMGFSYE